jgi:hypothetical protein
MMIIWQHVAAKPFSRRGKAVFDLPLTTGAEPGRSILVLRIIRVYAFSLPEDNVLSLKKP